MSCQEWRLDTDKITISVSSEEGRKSVGVLSVCDQLADRWKNNDC